MRLRFGNKAGEVYELWKLRGDANYLSLKETILTIVKDPSSQKGQPFTLNDGLVCRSFGQGLLFVYSSDDDVVTIEAISAPNDTGIKKLTGKQHQAALELMGRFKDNGRPKLGIFWYDYNNDVLFGVEKGDAELYVTQGRLATFPKLHKTYWQKMHYKAVSKGDTESVFYNEHDYTQIPRGRVFLEDGKYYVNVGSWINGYINGNKCIDSEKLRELVSDEFNLPDSFEFRQDEHWDIGHGWSEEQF